MEHVITFVTITDPLLSCIRLKECVMCFFDAITTRLHVGVHPVRHGARSQMAGLLVLMVQIRMICAVQLGDCKGSC